MHVLGSCQAFSAGPSNVLLFDIVHCSELGTKLLCISEEERWSPKQAGMDQMLSFLVQLLNEASDQSHLP